MDTVASRHVEPFDLSDHRCRAVLYFNHDHGDGNPCRHVDQCVKWRGHPGEHTNGRSIEWGNR